MAQPAKVISAKDLEAMTAAERATILGEALVTDLDSLDDRTAAVVARGGDKVRARLQTQE